MCDEDLVLRWSIAELVWFILIFSIMVVAMVVIFWDNVNYVLLNRLVINPRVITFLIAAFFRISMVALIAHDVDAGGEVREALIFCRQFIGVFVALAVIFMDCLIRPAPVERLLLSAVALICEMTLWLQQEGYVEPKRDFFVSRARPIEWIPVADGGLFSMYFLCYVDACFLVFPNLFCS